MKGPVDQRKYVGSAGDRGPPDDHHRRPVPLTSMFKEFPAVFAKPPAAVAVRDGAAALSEVIP
ncbi:hypothetical protein TPA0908_32870 [Micromonospora sp. AKA38]|nr:hypothetical protein TPA0908_32870 [Micromonospora sp. AKA38]